MIVCQLLKEDEHKEIHKEYRSRKVEIYIHKLFFNSIHPSVLIFKGKKINKVNKENSLTLTIIVSTAYKEQFHIPLFFSLLIIIFIYKEKEAAWQLKKKHVCSC